MEMEAPFDGLLSCTHSAYALTTAGSNPSQIDILGELRDTAIQRIVSHFYLRPNPYIDI